MVVNGGWRDVWVLTVILIKRVHFMHHAKYRKNGTAKKGGMVFETNRMLWTIWKLEGVYNTD